MKSIVTSTCLFFGLLLKVYSAAMHTFTIEVFSIIFLFSNIPSTLSVSLSFNFSGFETHENNRFINTTGDAYISPQGIQFEFNVTRVARIGRATYIEPLHLWDKKSGNLSDFSTHFSFVIDSSGRAHFADGITAFFFAPVYSSIKSDFFGGSMGLDTDNVYSNSSAETFFAVEFDTYKNAFDPSSPHVGININSMVSVATADWQNDVTQGRENEAWISYNGSSKILSVNFTNFFNYTRTFGSLSSVIDFRYYMPEKVMFGFSAAKTGDLFERNTVKSWDFHSSLTLDIASMVPAPSPIPINIVHGKRKRKHGVGVLALGLGAGSPLLILVLGFASSFLNKRRHNEESLDRNKYAIGGASMQDDEFERGSTGANKFSYMELANGTNDFAEEFKVGVYKGFLKETNSHVAVKRVLLSSGSHQAGLKDCASEVKIISKLRHRNLVQLIGWCDERDDQILLVYEFLPNGSLDSHLFERNSLLTWEVRYKIAQGLASALLYLHEEWEQCVVHGDIKSRNIMLDSNLDAKLGDFGLSRLVDREKGSETRGGYMAPEYMTSGKASKESDIYSFGVVLLEIASGRKAVDATFQEKDQLVLVEWVWKLYGAGKILEAVDENLRTEQNREEMERLLVVGLWCVHVDFLQRPAILQAMNVMNSEARLPDLGAPMPLYHSASNSGEKDSLDSSHRSKSSNFTTCGSDPCAPLLNTV